MRHLTSDVDGVLRMGDILICDRDRKRSPGARRLVETARVRVIQTPFRAPNCNAYAERFIRSIKEECLIGSFRSANAIYIGYSANSWRTMKANEITKALATSSLSANLRSFGMNPFFVVSPSADFRATTTVRQHECNAVLDRIEFWDITGSALCCQISQERPRYARRPHKRLSVVCRGSEG
jgi:hypothetical protein